MGRTCSICSHPSRVEIDKALVAGEPFRIVAGRFGTSVGALSRHRSAHIADLLALARKSIEDHAADLQAQVAEQDAREQVQAVNVLAELQRLSHRANLLLDACHEWLTDPSNPDRYTLEPRAEEVWVIYSETDEEGKSRRRKEHLARLLEKIEGNGRHVEGWETKHADPRKLLLEAVGTLREQLGFYARYVGEIDDRPQVNILVDAEWLATRGALLRALWPYPDARAAVAAELMKLEAGDGSGR